MITLSEALKIAESEVGKVDSILDCGDRWAISFYCERDKFGAISMFVFKDSGVWEYFAYTMKEYHELLRKGKSIPLPNDSD